MHGEEGRGQQWKDDALSAMVFVLCIAVRETTANLIVFFNDTATTEIYTLSLHDALPILATDLQQRGRPVAPQWHAPVPESSVPPPAGMNCHEEEPSARVNFSTPNSWL